ncbi:hypothetical protein DFA_06215 [Cavenderia fasciculata]|uniref:Uncharacterized protein n=1 Tax=Cavenderia fasciculata TaxID=261658 RepID=F4PKF3_CACFS|nr:uncharacterized protein DFA_06215 [Cavenderia fasciculata]EGG24077.1 hypothetical protein DFA_06215 [Cavenderia fasciculata]|eukprot:XP_004361928.1 hypothetical protein DFA_06215 [Cavenderia fasciculata]
MVLFSFTLRSVAVSVLLLLFVSSSSLQQINATYLIAVSYDNPNCTGAPTSAFSMVIGQCYIGGVANMGGSSPRSYMYNYNQTTGRASIQSFKNEDCAPRQVTTTKNNLIGRCAFINTDNDLGQRYLSFQVSELPLLPVEGYFFYEKHINSSNCSDTRNAGRTLITRSEAFDRYISFIKADRWRISVVPRLSLYLIIWHHVVNPFDRIFKIMDISTSWSGYLTYSAGYSMSYQTDGIGAQIPLTSNCSTSIIGCVLTFPNNIGHHVRLYISPNFYAPPGFNIPVFIRGITFPILPRVTSFNVTSLLHDSIEIVYGVRGDYLSEVKG